MLCRLLKTHIKSKGELCGFFGKSLICLVVLYGYFFVGIILLDGIAGWIG